MRTSIRLAAILIAAAGPPLLAQGPGAPGGSPPVGGMGPGGAGADRGAAFLLAHTGDLELTDAQVVKLAAIARRGAVRLRGLRASMDSARMRFNGPPTPADSAARRQFRGRMRAEATRMRDQFSADQRDAIAVLTPDQQGRAWQMVSRAGRARGRGGMGMRRGMRMGGWGMGRGGMPGLNGRGRMRNFGPGRMGPDGGRSAQPGMPPNPRRPPRDSAQQSAQR